ncbi:winged helix DNA-binding domain-containing protein [Kribbia dieselivorans]|uniref:winged helix DNA-binding domain-containing protein n=1 Tax=Kribbia dieselivorans TaxID=331526 RepID=UPI00083915BD|nr:winged helix DNA-binding domain-containing protein [Kribbia dieselivorans]
MPAPAPCDVALMRLVSLGLAGPRPVDPLEAVTRLSCVQGQDLPGALISVALRTVGRSVVEVRDALDDGSIVRSWPMRGTLHLVRADDLGWILSLTGPKVFSGTAARRAALGIDEGTLAKAAEVSAAALADGGLTRAELLKAFDDAGLEPTSGRGYHLLYQLAVSGHVHQAHLDGKDQRWVVSQGRLPAPRRDGERVELIGAWFADFVRGHGPVTLADFTRWSGLGVVESRAGAALVTGDLLELDLDGVSAWVDPAVPDLVAEHRSEARAVRLLPGFDEFILGYKDRSAQLPPEHETTICPGGNGVFKGTVVAGGQVVGTWKKGRKAGTVDATPFGMFSDTRARAVAAVASDAPFV